MSTLSLIRECEELVTREFMYEPINKQTMNDAVDELNRFLLQRPGVLNYAVEGELNPPYILLIIKAVIHKEGEAYFIIQVSQRGVVAMRVEKNPHAEDPVKAYERAMRGI